MEVQCSHKDSKKVKITTRSLTISWRTPNRETRLQLGPNTSPNQNQLHRRRVRTTWFDATTMAFEDAELVGEGRHGLWIKEDLPPFWQSWTGGITRPPFGQKSHRRVEDRSRSFNTNTGGDELLPKHCAPEFHPSSSILSPSR